MLDHVFLIKNDDHEVKTNITLNYMLDNMVLNLWNFASFHHLYYKFILANRWNVISPKTDMMIARIHIFWRDHTCSWGKHL